MARHTNKRRNTRRRRQTRGRRRTQRGGGLFSTKQEDIDSNNKNIQEYQDKITKIKEENQKLTSELNTPDEGFWSKLVGSKKKENTGSSGEQVAPENRMATAPENRMATAPEGNMATSTEGSMDTASESFSYNQSAGSRRRRRHRKK
jgi:hypothetical protein